MSAKSPTSKSQLERAAQRRHKQRYLLRLYITGTTPASSRAVEKVRTICEEHLQGRYQLEVFDIYRMPALAKDEQIIATPTLIKVLPSPLRRFIGDLTKIEAVLFGLDLRRKA
jgi:circadian clock protein KaiB